MNAPPVLAAAILLLLVACGPKADTAGNPAADTTAVAAAPDTMTGDPDRDFLRMMSDHHKGLILLAHESMLKGGRGTAESQTDAFRVDATQDRELELMVKMLEGNYQDPYEPKVAPADQAVVQSVQANAGAAYASAFYRAVVAHHRRAITMVEEYLPRAKRADVKAMAEKMKQDHQAEIQEFERKEGTK